MEDFNEDHRRISVADHENSGGVRPPYFGTPSWAGGRILPPGTYSHIYGPPSDPDPACKWILYYELGSSRVRVWDLMILVPNALFLLLLVCRCNRARLKLRATSSAIFCAFYSLVVVNVIVSVIRCAVSMTVNAALPTGSHVDKVLWVVVRFFLLSTELSVVIFGLAFGHLDSNTSIRRVLLCTSFISLTYSVSQGALEIVAPDENFYVPRKDYKIFGHGGMLFWFTSSVVFAVLYGIILILPWTSLRDRLALPTKKSFYLYILFLALLNAIQAVGSGLLFYHENDCGLCVVDVTTFVYFTLFTPLVYQTFLSEFFSVSQPSILFSYKAQVDEAIEEDTVSLPHQLSCSSLKTDSDYIYQNNLLYDSTQFEAGTPINPLYAHSLQSPDSFTGYDDGGMSRSNSINSEPGYQRLQQQPNASSTTTTQTSSVLRSTKVPHHQHHDLAALNPK